MSEKLQYSTDKPFIIVLVLYCKEYPELVMQEKTEKFMQKETKIKQILQHKHLIQLIQLTNTNTMSAFHVTTWQFNTASNIKYSLFNFLSQYNRRNWTLHSTMRRSLYILMFSTIKVSYIQVCKLKTALHHVAWCIKSWNSCILLLANAGFAINEKQSVSHEKS